jgi:hypothetical protein
LFELFEPTLEHNRDQFRRLSRRQLYVLFGSFLSAVLFLTFAAIVSAPGWVLYVLLPLVFFAGGAMGVLEIQKVIVFRRDLRERRDVSATRSSDCS